LSCALSCVPTILINTSPAAGGFGSPSGGPATAASTQLRNLSSAGKRAPPDAS